MTSKDKGKPDVRGQIKKYLGASGVSQVWLSNKIGMNPSTLSVTLNEKRILQAEEFFLICDALNVSYDYFKQQTEAMYDYHGQNQNQHEKQEHYQDPPTDL